MSRVAERARRHPRAILLTWLWFAVWGLVLAWPVAAVVGRDFRGNPDADAALFRPGALDLLDYWWRARTLVYAELGHLVVLVPIAILGSTIPLVLLLLALAEKSRLRSPARTVGTLAIFEVGAFLLQGLSLWLALQLATLTSSGLLGSFGEVRADMSGVAVFAFGVVVVLILSIYRDLISAALVGCEGSVRDALVAGGKALLARPFATWWAWLWRAVVGLVLVIAATCISAKIGGKSGLFLIALALAHQGAVAWRVAWRASWLAASLRLVAMNDEP